MIKHIFPAGCIESRKMIFFYFLMQVKAFYPVEVLKNTKGRTAGNHFITFILENMAYFNYKFLKNHHLSFALAHILIGCIIIYGFLKFWMYMHGYTLKSNISKYKLIRDSNQDQNQKKIKIEHLAENIKSQKQTIEFLKVSFSYLNLFATSGVVFFYLNLVFAYLYFDHSKILFKQFYLLFDRFFFKFFFFLFTLIYICGRLKTFIAIFQNSNSGSFISSLLPKDLNSLYAISLFCIILFVSSFVPYLSNRNYSFWYYYFISGTSMLFIFISYAVSNKEYVQNMSKIENNTLDQ